MPPPLALFLCTLFVVGLLCIEQRQSAVRPPALWIPTLWMLLIACKPLGVWFGATGDAESGSALDRLVLSGIGLVAVIVLARRRLDVLQTLRENQWLVALLGYMLLSTLWSEITFVALKRWVRDALVVVMALLILSEPNPRLALESLLRRSAYILIPFSLLLIKYYPTLGVEYGRWSGQQMWVGVTVHKNTLGRLCLVAAFFLIWALYRRWRDGALRAQRYLTLADAAVLLMALHMLRGAEGAYSATSIGTFAVGASTFLGLVWLRRHQVVLPRTSLLLLITFLIGFGTAAPFLRGANVAGISSKFGRNETLTGRTETWDELVPVVKSRPLLGVGFGSFWTTARREFYQMSHGHNGYLDILLELGIVGMGFYVALLLDCGRKLHATLAADHDWASLGICFLLMALVYNVTESALNSLAEQMTAVMILLALGISTFRPVWEESDATAALDAPPVRVLTP